MLWLAVFGPEYGHLWGAEVGLPPWTAASALAGSFIFAQYLRDIAQSALRKGRYVFQSSLNKQTVGRGRGQPGSFLIWRHWPGKSNDMTVEKALQKFSKLKASNADLNILLLEQNSVAGSVFS